MWAALLLSAARAEPACSDWLPAAAVGTLSEALPETSGLAASALHPGVLWAHNDAGDSPTLYAVSASDGALLGTLSIEGAFSEDWEDLAAGPCGPSETCGCLYVGDIGDNDADRAGGTIYRIREPGDAPSGAQAAAADGFPFRYPDGARDAEALAVHPLTAQVFVLTKGTPARVYALPTSAEPDTISELVFVQELALSATSPQLTAADFSPGGGRLALRTEAEILVLGDGSSTAPADLFESAQRRLLAPDTPDAEALTFSRDGGVLYTTSEGTGAPLWALDCADGGSDSGALAEACPDEGELEPGCGCGGGGAAGLLAPLLGWAMRRRPAAHSSSRPAAASCAAR